MKKLALVFLFALAITSAALAQSYTVQEISGRVERELGDGWVPLISGEKIAAETVIRTGIGASLIVKIGGQILGVGPTKTGKISELAGSGSAIQIKGSVSRIDTSSVNRNTGRVSTASARAKNASAETEVEE